MTTFSPPHLISHSYLVRHFYTVAVFQSIDMYTSISHQCNVLGLMHANCHQYQTPTGLTSSRELAPSGDSGHVRSSQIASHQGNSCPVSPSHNAIRAANLTSHDFLLIKLYAGNEIFCRQVIVEGRTRLNAMATITVSTQTIHRLQLRKSALSSHYCHI